MGELLSPQYRLSISLNLHHGTSDQKDFLVVAAVHKAASTPPNPILNVNVCTCRRPLCVLRVAMMSQVRSDDLPHSEILVTEY